MTNTSLNRIATGMTIAAFAFVLILAVPESVDATTYNNGYRNYGYTNYGNNYGNYHYNPYPPAPTYYTIPSVQTTYSNGYYQNYFVPTVRYFPAPYALPVQTTYYPSPAPVYTYPRANNFPAYNGYYY